MSCIAKYPLGRLHGGHFFVLAAIAHNVLAYLRRWLSIALSPGSSLSFIMNSKRSTSSLFALTRYSRAASSLLALGMLPPSLGSICASVWRPWFCTADQYE
jgi:hypothetical protein